MNRQMYKEKKRSRWARARAACRSHLSGAHLIYRPDPHPSRSQSVRQRWGDVRARMPRAGRGCCPSTVTPEGWWGRATLGLRPRLGGAPVPCVSGVCAHSPHSRGAWADVFTQSELLKGGHAFHALAGAHTHTHACTCKHARAPHTCTCLLCACRLCVHARAPQVCTCTCARMHGHACAHARPTHCLHVCRCICVLAHVSTFSLQGTRGFAGKWGAGPTAAYSHPCSPACLPRASTSRTPLLALPSLHWGTEAPHQSLLLPRPPPAEQCSVGTCPTSPLQSLRQPGVEGGEAGQPGRQSRVATQMSRARVGP